MPVSEGICTIFPHIAETPEKLHAVALLNKVWLPEGSNSLVSTPFKKSWECSMAKGPSEVYSVNGQYCCPPDDALCLFLTGPFFAHSLLSTAWRAYWMLLAGTLLLRI